MIRLFVNVDHVATIREARNTIEPSPLKAALLAEKAGAQGITIHLREDRRHIQDDDVRIIRKEINTLLNMEMAPTKEMVDLALEIQPYQVSEHKVSHHKEYLRNWIADNNVNFNFDDIWNIRERCIKSLSENSK